MEHPDPQIRQNQEDFLNSLPSEEKPLHARLFRIGNASIHYYNRKESEPTQEDYEAWLQGLPEAIREDMRTQGFENARKSIPLKRFALEYKDHGMKEFMREHLSEADYQFYLDSGK